MGTNLGGAGTDLGVVGTHLGGVETLNQLLLGFYCVGHPLNQPSLAFFQSVFRPTDQLTDQPTELDIELAAAS